ncbi:Tyrosine-protein kinase CpsD [Phycisphaerae bacterium RAS1]|nr:Tyrosine-protein kinase CpsD [Phycisphaerae bacterium RAS1]
MSESEVHDTTQPVRALAKAGPIGPAGALAAPLIIDADAGAAPSTPVSLAMLWRFKWTIAGTFMLCAAAGLGLIWTAIRPAYSASGVIHIKPVRDDLLSGRQDVMPMYESFRQTQASFVTNAEVRNGVLEDSAVKGLSWFAARPLTFWDRLISADPVEQRFDDDVNVIVPPGKQLIEVSISTPWPGEAAVLVNKILENYKRNYEDRQSAEDNTDVRALERAAADLKRRIEARADEIKVVRKDLNLGAGSPAEVVVKRQVALDERRAELWTLRKEIALDEKRLERAKAQHAASTDAGDAAPDPAAAEKAAFERNAEWRGLRRELQTARDNLAAGLRRWDEGHYKIQSLKNEVTRVEQQVAALETDLRDRLTNGRGDPDTGDFALTDPRVIELRLSRLRDEEAVLAGLLDEEEARYENASRLASRLVEVEREVEADTHELDNLEKQLNIREMRRATEVTVAMSTAVAKPPVDKRVKLSAAALFGALIAGLGAGFVRLRFSATVTSMRDVSRPLQQTLIGSVPLRRGVSAEVLTNCPIQTESVRVLRTAFLNRLKQAGCSVVQFTSVGPRTGKSTLVGMLGRSLAAAGKRVLLVDGDVRRGSLTAAFRAAGTAGLLDDLSAPSPTVTVHSTDTPNLSLVPVGRIAKPEDAELFANGAFGRLLEAWKKAYDVVLVDSAPLLMASESVMLAQRVDGTIMVIREQHCRRHGLTEVIELLDSAGGTLLGTVFVGSTTPSGYASYNYYGSYAQYGRSASTDATD